MSLILVGVDASEASTRAVEFASMLGFSDAAIFLMSIPNVIGLYLLARVLKHELTQYREKVATGEFAKVDADVR